MNNTRAAFAGLLFAVAACATGAGVDSLDEDDDGSSTGDGGGNALVTGSGGSTAAGGNGCPEGSEPSGGDCVDIDECAEMLDDCDELVTCTNTDPGFTCGDCPMGSADVNGDGTACVDIDECAQMMDDCDPLAECINDEPGFHCGPCPANSVDVNGDGTQCDTYDAIGLDARHGFNSTTDNFATGSNFAQMRTAIESSGRTVTVLNTMEADDLTMLGAVFVQQPYNQQTAFSATEIATITAFVQNGGGLVLFGDGGSGANQTNLNAVATPWGCTFSSTPMFPNGYEVTNLYTHPITTGVTSFGIDYGVPITTASPAEALHPTSTTLLAAADGVDGAGNVVCLADGLFNNSTGTDYDINSLDNLTLLTNILSHVAP